MSTNAVILRLHPRSRVKWSQGPKFSKPRGAVGGGHGVGAISTVPVLSLTLLIPTPEGKLPWKYCLGTNTSSGALLGKEGEAAFSWEEAPPGHQVTPGPWRRWGQGWKFLSQGPEGKLGERKSDSRGRRALEQGPKAWVYTQLCYWLWASVYLICKMDSLS